MRYGKNVRCSLWDDEKLASAFRGLINNFLMLQKLVNIITIISLNREVQKGHWKSE